MNDSALRVVLDPRAHLGEEGVGRLAAPGHDEEVAGELAPVDLDRPQDASAAAGDDLADALAPEVVDAVQLHACLLQGGGGLAPRLVHGHDDGLLGGLDAPVLDQPADSVGEHHADEVVAREDERLLDRPRRDDDLLGAEPVEDAARVDGDEPAFPDPERPPGRDDVHAFERVDEALVHEDDLPSSGGVLPGSLAARPAAADDQHLGAAVLDVVAVCAAGVLVQLAQSGDVAKELLVERPGPPRPDHRAVVEADRGERAAELVGGDEHVVLQRAQDVLRADDRALADGLGADAHVGDTVHGHHAVRAAAGAAEKPARPVVLEAPREDPLAGGVERGPEGVSLEGPDRLAVEREGHLPVAVEPLSWSGGEPHLARASCSAGSKISVRSTSFVLVSRSAWNQISQPWR